MMCYNSILSSVRPEVRIIDQLSPSPHKSIRIQILKNASTNIQLFVRKNELYT